MAKPPPTKKSAKAAQPAPAQLKSVERLIESEDYDLAIERAESLVERYPDHGGVWRLLVEALAEGEGEASAALAAYRWVERRPNSLPAQEALFGLAADLGLSMLADRAGAEVRRLGGETPDFPLGPEDIESLLAQRDGSRATRGQVELMELGELQLELGEFAGALAALEGVPLAAARASRAVALFHLLRIDEALEGFLDACRLDPQNTHALSWVLRIRLLLGDESGARALGTRLAECRPRGAQDAVEQIDGLLLIGEDRAAWEAFEQAMGEDWAGDPDAPGAARLRQRGGAAAARLGMGREALDLWRQALELDEGLEPAEDLLDESRILGRPPAWPGVIESILLLPEPWLDDLEDVEEPDLPRVAAACPASDAYLGAVYRSGDAATRWAAGLALELRALGGAAPVPDPGPGAVEVIRALVRLPIGPWAEHIRLVETLLAAAGAGGKGPSGPVPDELLPRLKLNPEIDSGPGPEDLPPDLARLLADTEVHLDRGRLAQAESGLLAILAQVPDHPLAAGRLAELYSGQGRAERSLGLLRQAAEAHPDSALACCNLCCALIELGELGEAETRLARIAESPRMHIREAVALVQANAMLAAAQGELHLARFWARILAALAEQWTETPPLWPIEERVQRILLARLDALPEGGATP